MFDLKSKLAAMQGQAPQPQGQDEGEMDMPKPKTPTDMNPTSQEGDEFFVDPDMLPEGYKCQKGDELMVKARVTSKGSKIGLTPVEISEQNDATDGSDEEEGPQQ